MPVPAVAGAVVGLGRLLLGTTRFFGRIANGVRQSWLGGAAVWTAAGIATFFSRFLSNFLGGLLAMAARPGLIVIGVYFAGMMIYHFLAVLLLGFDTYVLGGTFWSSGLGNFMRYFAVLVGLDVLLPLGLTLLPLRIFWRRFTISL